MMAADRTDDDCEQLLARVARGERAALGELFAAEAGRLIAIARRIVRRREVAEEIVQDAFVAVWRSAGRFDPARGPGRAWLTTIVRNRALNAVRDGARLDFADEEQLALFSDRRGDAHAAYEALAEGDALRRCLSTLEPRRRESILLAYVLGCTHGEIAARLDAPVGTVKAWIRRGVIALQECLS
ncbi:sigma-70 family RNA polymerase sigma factor [Aquibium carbonis]|nr:sigma-70 family RNA polymerase sigma factor [Aquibium carbonis]